MIYIYITLHNCVKWPKRVTCLRTPSKRSSHPWIRASHLGGIVSVTGRGFASGKPNSAVAFRLDSRAFVWEESAPPRPSSSSPSAATHSFLVTESFVTTTHYLLLHSLPLHSLYNYTLFTTTHPLLSPTFWLSRTCYICIYHIHVFVYMSMYRFDCLQIVVVALYLIYMFLYICLYVYIFIRVCVYVCVYVCVCIYVYTCLYIHGFTYMHTRKTHTHTHKYILQKCSFDCALLLLTMAACFLLL